MNPIYYVVKEGKVIASCTSWAARAAALRLLCGSSLMLPKGYTAPEGDHDDA